MAQQRLYLRKAKSGRGIKTFYTLAGFSLRYQSNVMVPKSNRTVDYKTRYETWLIKLEKREFLCVISI